ncbi:MAG: hypothetical protein RMJ28_07240 [Nitrososphaerota archaeon]|nr:hypothetical protein [Candidatus Calditenuaceae archaeon]MDW8074008.1 hypothetical protein [Nitrososphaerota archaeon]
MRGVAFTVLLVALALAVNTAYSESEAATVSNRYGLPLTVNGDLVEKFPAKVSPGSNVCVVHHVYYLASDRRLVFRGWSSGETTPCVTAKSDVLEALYDEEVLVILDSNYEPLRRSFWVRRGERVVLEAEKFYFEGGFRYVFERWSMGESPFGEVNILVVTEPVYVEARFRREVRVDVISIHGAPVNGSGWYRLGDLVVISAPREIRVGDRERLVFREWVSVGLYPAIIQGAGSTVATLEAMAPHAVRAEYDRYFKVYVAGPEGVIVDDWFREGEALHLSTPPTIELIPNAARLFFIGWEGDIASSTPGVKLTVNSPVTARAVYRLEYRVDVRSPAGAAGSGWYPANSTAVVWAPAELQAFLFAKRVLSRYAGDCGEGCFTRGPLSIKVDSPKYVEAVYGLEPDLPSIGGAGAVAAALVAVQIVNKRRRGKPAGSDSERRSNG